MKYFEAIDEINEEKTFVKNIFDVEDLLYYVLCSIFCLFIVTQVYSVVLSLSSNAWESDSHSQLEIFSAWGLFQLILETKLLINSS